tara:strand:+ start:616 stop:834 length:219 start_codon:yes stop_codon:yes gene_type:complete
MKRTRQPRRTAEQLEKLTKDIVTYYFDNPHANGYKIIEEKFNCTPNVIRKIISDELDNRFKNKRQCINVLED